MTFAHIPDDKRLCSDCSHGALTSAGGVYCLEFREDIPNENVAQDCVAYEEAVPSSHVVSLNGRSPSPRPAVADIDVLVKDRAMPRPKVQVDEVVAEEPAPELVAACESYFEARHCVLWGMPFEVITPKGRAEAADWLARQITGVGYVAAK